MRCRPVALFVALPPNAPTLAQIARAPSSEREAIVRLVQEAAARPLGFDQGDVKSLTDARDDFAPEGWSAHAHTNSK